MKNIFTPTPISSLAKWLYYIEHLHDKPIELDLDRIRHVATYMDLLNPATWIITVGGTNGKGTTCKLLEAILLASNMRVGVYSSPHLLSYTERVRIQGNELSEVAHSEAMTFIELGRGTTSLSYFEFTTLVALKLFKQAVLDVVILEVGLGGALDATNIINSDLAVITSIALDHTDLLGMDLDSIAREKAGIFRPGKTAVIGELHIPSSLYDVASNCGANLYVRDQDWWWYNDGKYWHWWDNVREFIALPLPLNIPLENAATAIAAIASLPFIISESAIHHGLRKASLPGRFQCINLTPLTILDVAHNPHAARYLSQRLSKLPIHGKIRAVVGMLANKDIKGTIAYLNEQVDVWYYASLNLPHAASSKQLAELLNNDAQQFNCVISAWFQAMAEAKSDDCVLVFGSFYTVAPILMLVKNYKYRIV